MTEPTFLTDEALRTMKTIHKLRKVLLKESQVYRSQLYKNCAFRITEEHFDSILDGLVACHFCTLQHGALGGVLVTINPQVRDAEVSQ